MSSGTQCGRRKVLAAGLATGWWLLPAVGGGALGGGALGADSESQTFRIGASMLLVGEVNENDARAAIRTWADVISRQTGMRIEYEPTVLASSEHLLQAVREGMVDGFAATLPEYLQVARYVDPTRIMVEEDYVKAGEEYLILAHQDSEIRTLSDLRGRNVLLYKTSTTSLVGDWLEALFNEANLGPPERFLAAVVPVPKLSRSVLPVFFRQADACLITRRGFDIMCEMNPQIARKLRVLATSPKLVPVVMAFHKDCPADRARQFETAVTGLHQTPVGRQVLTLFQSHGVVTAETSVLRTSEDLMRNAERLRERNGKARR